MRVGEPLNEKVKERSLADVWGVGFHAVVTYCSYEYVRRALKVKVEDSTVVRRTWK